MHHIVRRFFQGLIVVVPIVGTVYVVYWLFVKIDGLLGLEIPGVGFLLTIIFITLVGYLASNILTQKLFDWTERVFTKLPFIRLLYISIKDLTGAFVGDKKAFNKPALVSLTADGSVKAIGFITSHGPATFGLSDYVAVYLPQSYNFAGNLLLFPKDQVEPLAAESSDVMAFLVSGGVSGKTP
jgi:uncharacterized membrane protein